MWISGNYSVECIDGFHEMLSSINRALWKAVWKVTDRRTVAKMGTIYRRETQQLHWLPLRTSVSAAAPDTLLTTTTSKKANVPSHAYPAPPGMNFIELRVRGKTDGDTATVYIYSARRDDDIVLLCTLACTVGSQVATDGSLYVDTMTVTEYWLKDLETADIAGGDRMSRVGFDNLGYKNIFALINPISAGTWHVDISGG